MKNSGMSRGVLLVLLEVCLGPAPQAQPTPTQQEEVVAQVAGFRLTEYTMTDVRFVALSADSGLIVYRLAESGTSHGKEFAAKVHVSSLWLRRGGKWMCVFSQETGAR
jgi:hypothetical protein